MLVMVIDVMLVFSYGSRFKPYWAGNDFVTWRVYAGQSLCDDPGDDD